MTKTTTLDFEYDDGRYLTCEAELQINVIDNSFDHEFGTHNPGESFELDEISDFTDVVMTDADGNKIEGYTLTEVDIQNLTAEAEKEIQKHGHEWLNDAKAEAELDRYLGWDD